MTNYLKTSAVAVALSIPLLAFGQSKGSSPAPELRYHSAFADYKRWQDIDPADWRAANDTVREVGATREGNVSPSAADEPPEATPASSASMPHHGGHHSHGAAK